MKTFESGPCDSFPGHMAWEKVEMYKADEKKG